MYTVGPDYAHAEARKSPALDGKVERDSEGKEIRYPVMLTAMEKLVARKVCVAFKVCIFFPVQAGLLKCLICVRVGVKTCRSGMSQAWQSSRPDAVVGPAGCGNLLGRGDWEGKSACSKCPLGWQVPGVPHKSEHLILDPEHAALHLSCARPVLTISCFCLCGKFSLIFLGLLLLWVFVCLLGVFCFVLGLGFFWFGFFWCFVFVFGFY